MKDLFFTSIESERVADSATLAEAIPYAIAIPEKWPAELQPIEYLMFFGPNRDVISYALVGTSSKPQSLLVLSGTLQVHQPTYDHPSSVEPVEFAGFEGSFATVDQKRVHYRLMLRCQDLIVKIESSNVPKPHLLDLASSLRFLENK